MYAGDEIYVDTDYTGGNDATFYFQDLTPGHQFNTSVSIAPLDTQTQIELLYNYVDQTDNECVIEENAAPTQYSQVNVSDCFYSGSDTVGYDYAYNGNQYTICIDEGYPGNVQDYLETYETLDTSINGFYSASEHVHTNYNGCPM